MMKKVGLVAATSLVISALAFVPVKIFSKEKEKVNGKIKHEIMEKTPRKTNYLLALNDDKKIKKNYIAMNDEKKEEKVIAKNETANAASTSASTASLNTYDISPVPNSTICNVYYKNGNESKVDFAEALKQIKAPIVDGKEVFPQKIELIRFGTGPQKKIALLINGANGLLIVDNIRDRTVEDRLPFADGVVDIRRYNTLGKISDEYIRHDFGNDIVFIIQKDNSLKNYTGDLIFISENGGGFVAALKNLCKSGGAEKFEDLKIIGFRTAKSDEGKTYPIVDFQGVNGKKISYAIVFDKNDPKNNGVWEWED